MIIRVIDINVEYAYLRVSAAPPAEDPGYGGKM